MKALVDKGLVKLGNFTASEDKRRYAYVLTPKGIAEKAAITKRFLERMLEEYEALRAKIEELRRESRASTDVGWTQADGPAPDPFTSQTSIVEGLDAWTTRAPPIDPCGLPCLAAEGSP